MGDEMRVPAYGLSDFWLLPVFRVCVLLSARWCVIC